MDKLLSVRRLDDDVSAIELKRGELEVPEILFEEGGFLEEDSRKTVADDSAEPPWK
jgi:hypothetical protein